MNTSENGMHFIEIVEGYKYESYRDSKGILTIGVGHTGADVTPDAEWTTAQIEAALANDLKTAENAVNNLGVDLSQPQFDALVSLCFNIGATAFGISTVATELRKKRYLAAADAILMWDDHGLLSKRRQAERGVFLYGAVP